MRAPSLVVPGLVVALAALAGLGGAASSPGPGPAPVVRAAVVGATLVCPALRRDDPVQLTTRVAAGVVRLDLPAAAGEPSTFATLPLGATTAQPVPLTGGQVVTGLGEAVPGDALVVRARGPLAGGLQAQQLTRSPSGPRRGSAVLPCTTPRTDGWYAGGSAGAAEQSSLVLANPDDVAAVVDVEVWSAEGPAGGRSGRGLVVPPGGRTTVPLDTLAPGRTGLALHVTAARGRFTAAVEHARAGGEGVEAVAAGPAPAGHVDVPGLPAGPGERALLVTNPGSAPVTAQVRLSAGDGQFVPVGLERVQVPAGTTVRVDLTALLAATPAAATVTSDGGPVLAVGLAVAGTAPGQDLAYAPAAGPLTGPALVADVPQGSSALLVSALDADADVVVTPLPTAGVAPVEGARTVPVPGGSTVAVPLPSGAYEVRPAEGSAPVHATALLREDLADGPLVTLLALAAASADVARPPVRSDVGAVLR